jgi:hypothetical protein
MCIITNLIENISDTKIIVNINNQLEQLTIYSNSINNINTNNYMILPVPNPDTVEFLNIDIKTLNNLSQHQFFDTKDTNELLYFRQYNNITLCKSYDELRTFLNNKNVNIYTMCIKHLNNYSGKLWGFIVCQLSVGNFQYMPLCYKHKMMVSHIYIPTKKWYSFDFYDNINKQFKLSINYDWDHYIYLINTTPSILLSSLSTNREYYTINDEHELIIDDKYNLGKYINIDKHFINSKKSNLNIDLFIFYFMNAKSNLLLL